MLAEAINKLGAFTGVDGISRELDSIARIIDHARHLKHQRCTHEQRITMRKFEHALAVRWGTRVSKDRIQERYCETVGGPFLYRNVTLYYLDDRHAGSWCQGKGWLFAWTASAKEKTVGRN